MVDKKHNISFSDSIIIADSDIVGHAKTVTFDKAMHKADSRCMALSAAY